MAALPAQGFLSPSQWAGPQKKGERDARAAGGARKRVARPSRISHAPSSVLPAWLVALPRTPAHWPSRWRGGGESAHAQAQFTEQVCVEVEWGTSGSNKLGLSFWGLLTIFNASNYHLLNISAQLQHSFIQHVFMDRCTWGPWPKSQEVHIPILSMTKLRLRPWPVWLSR